MHWRANEITLEADPRHAEMVIKQLGLEDGKGLTCVSADGKQDDCEDQLLSREESSMYRWLAARCNSIATDVVDVQFACKKICRDVHQPQASEHAGLEEARQIV